MIEQQALSIAHKLCDNQWWNEMAELDVKAKFPLQETERDLFVKRLQYWINWMEGNMATEAPMHTINLCQQVMKIVDRNIEKVNSSSK